MILTKDTMYNKLTKDDIYNKNYDEILYNFKINSDKKQIFEFICDQKGNMYRKMKSGYWKEIENKINHKKGYNVILINKKQYSRAKLMLYAQNCIKLNDKYINIYHKNKNKLDCSINNLEIKRD